MAVLNGLHRRAAVVVDRGAAVKWPRLQGSGEGRQTGVVKGHQLSVGGGYTGCKAWTREDQGRM